MCICNECGKEFNLSESYTSIFGETICPHCGSTDADEDENEQ